MKLKHLRFRQINLDFHTSPDIGRIGAAFDKKEWQETLQSAHVNSIHCFSKCHHGLSYHPTQVGTMHPHLTFDLLRAQMDACHEIDIKVPIYLSAGLDNTITLTHPEWRELTIEGELAGYQNPLRAGFHKLCFHTPYVDYLCRQIEESVTLFPEADGMVLDIIAQGPCCCNWCLDVMAKNGLDAEKLEDRLQCAQLGLHRYYQMTNAAARIHNPDFYVFHNSGHVTRGRRDWIAYQSHLELESLPTGGWGYDHFPESANYAAQTGRDYLGMTGKFHTTWGEFGGFKHPNALRYECAAMIAFGSKCAIGDQLHPEGRLDRSTYALIGAAYAEVAEKEAWCDHTVAVTDIGVLSSESENPFGARRNNQPDTGICRMLLEGHHVFALIDREVDFTPFRLLILPDDIAIDGELQTRIEAYLKQGGKLLLTGRSGLKKDGSGFAFDLGAEYGGPSPFEPDYLLPSPELRAPFVQSPMVMYARSQRIKAVRGQSLGQVFDPYFNRTFRHFCSHQHTPNRPEPSGYDGGVRHGNLVYLAHPVFTLYRTHGVVACKEFVLRVIDALLGERAVRVNLPSAGRVTLRRQPGERRQVVHLLYANKVVRGGKITCGGSASSDFILEIIEDLDPVRDLVVRVRPGAKISKVTLEPQGRAVSFQENDGELEIAIDGFTCHQMIVLQEA